VSHTHPTSSGIRSGRPRTSHIRTITPAIAPPRVHPVRTASYGHRGHRQRRVGRQVQPARPDPGGDQV
jgi:hypothetical protein